MNPTAIQVAIDILRELGRDQEARWLEHPDAVRELLDHTPLDVAGYGHDFRCAQCGVMPEDGHHPDCRVFLAWAALDDPRAAEAIGAAFDRARPVTSQPFNHGGGDWAWRAATAPPMALFPERYGRTLGERVDAHETGGTIPPRPPFRLASESEQAARERACEHWHRTETEYGFVTCNDCGAELTPRVHQQGDDAPGTTRCGEGVVGAGDQLVTCPECRRLYGIRYARVISDARGTEAVEAEARWQHRMLTQERGRYVLDGGEIRDTASR